MSQVGQAGSDIGTRLCKSQYGSGMDKRQKLLNRLDIAWREFLESYAGLSEPDMLMPAVTGSWCVKDIIAHVTTWEEEALTHLPLVLQGVRPPRYSVRYGGIDAFNAQASARKKVLSLPEVLRQRDAVHQKLVDFIGIVPDEHIESKTRFHHRLRLDTYGHYRKHAEAIRRWRTSISNYK